jgi:CRISPR/Cas system-associated endonuclease Cas3-HD
VEPENEDLKSLLSEVKEQYDADHLINVDAEEKERFEKLFKWMTKDGANFDKLKMRYYGPDYRGVTSKREKLSSTCLKRRSLRLRWR